MAISHRTVRDDPSAPGDQEQKGNFLSDLAALRLLTASATRIGSVLGYRHSFVMDGAMGEADRVDEDLNAEQMAFDSYTDIADFMGKADPTTRRILEGILAHEQEHAAEMASMLDTLSGRV
jgi:hypothetical protein